MNILNTIVCSGIEIDVIIPKLVSNIVKIITVLIPVVLIFLCMFDLFKSVIAQDDQHKDILKKLINRIKYGVLVLLMPAIVVFVLNILIDDKEAFTCVDCFIKGNCVTNSINNNVDNSNNENDNIEVPDDTVTPENNEVPSDDVIPENNKDTDLIVSPLEVSIEIGQEFELNVNAKDASYTSSNEDIATVTQNGVITGVNEGNAYIIVEENNDHVQIVVTVTNNINNQNVEIKSLYYEEDSYDMIIGSIENYMPIPTPYNADISTITYTSSKPKVATVNSNGDVQAMAEGSTVITATSGNKTATVKINVIKEDIEVPVKSISMDSNIGLKVGDTEQLSPVIKPFDATNKNIEFTSDDNSIVTVDKSGLVTALKKGKANIYAKAGGKTAITTVVVSSKEVLIEKIDLSKNEKKLKIGSTYQIKTVVKPTNATNKKLIYSSSDKSIVTVDKNGVVTGKKAGKATITVKSKDGNKSEKLNIEVVKSNKIHFIKTSTSADCILLESNGHYALIDTGKSSDYKAIKNYLEELDIKTLDFIILTHNHPDHIGSAQKIIRSYKPKTLYVKRYSPNDIKSSIGKYDKEYAESNMSKYNKYIDEANKVGTNIVYFDDQKEGYSIKLRDMNLKNYNLSNHLVKGSNYYRKASENINSVTTLITIGKLKTYLTSDLVYKSIAEKIAEKVGDVDVYKMIHHAYYNGTSEKEAKIVSPEYAIVTNSKSLLKTKENTVSVITKYTIGNKVYYSCDNTIIVDYTSGKIKISKK